MESLGYKSVVLQPIEHSRVNKVNMKEVTRFLASYVWALQTIEKETGKHVVEGQVLNVDEVGSGGHYHRQAPVHGYISKDTQGAFYLTEEDETSHITIELVVSAGRVPGGGLIISRQPFENHTQLPVDLAIGRP